MKIILEGPDNAGKTTLAEKLKTECPGLLYHHPGGRPGGLDEESNCMTSQARILSNVRPVLMDRCTAISQQVYTPDEVRDDVRRAWLKAAISAGVLIVYARPATDWLMSFENFTWREGETEEFKQEIISKQHTFIQRYDEIFKTLPHVHYDYKDEGASTLIKHLTLAILGNTTSRDLLFGLYQGARK